MALTATQASQIAALLNARNQLAVQYTGESVLQYANNYLCRLSEAGEVIACVEVKKVQWYQTEILHLTVAEPDERKGHAKALLCDAEKVARKNGARLLQCTIRDGNAASCQLFEEFGFMRVGTFFNEDTGNSIGIFQKVLVKSRKTSDHRML